VPVWLSPTIAGVSARALEPGVEALVIGEVTTRRGYTRVDALGVWRLADLEEQARRVARVRLNLEGENRATLKHLLDLAQFYPGSARIEPAGFAPGRGGRLMRLARQRVFFCSPYYQGLCKILPAERIELFDAQGEALSVSVGGAPPEPREDAEPEEPAGADAPADPEPAAK
jgi:hypothetical protein